MSYSKLYAIGSALFLAGLVLLVGASGYVAENPESNVVFFLVIGYLPVIVGIGMFTRALHRLFQDVEDGVRILKKMEEDIK